MRAMIAAGGGILIGVGLAYSEAERRARKKYEAYSASLSRSMAQARQQAVERPVLSEEDLQWESVKTEMSTIFDHGEIKVGGEMVVENPIATPDYVGEATRYADQSMFVPEMEYSMAYIQDEEYHEEDGRPKEQIVIFMGSDDVPLFVQDGLPIEDWAEKIGDSILVDFYKMVPPGAERVLYVRNNSRDEDYEVIQETV